MMNNPFVSRTARIGLLISIAVWLCHPSLTSASTLLGTAQSFAILGASTVTNTGASAISGNLGLYAGSSITGFPPGVVTQGTIHTTDAVAQQAQIDESYAYQTLALLPFTIDESGIDLGGQTLTPGVYKFSSAAALNGTLTLDFQGNANALFVFQVGSTLITGSGATVDVINGGASNGIFWQVGSSATLGSGTTFAGNILALASVTMVTGAKIECGRAFAQTGAVTLDSNVVSSDCSINDFGSGRGDFAGSGFSPESTIPIVTPEPATFLILGVSLTGFVLKHTSRRKRKA
jgi:type VI secretion system secreted protein VgrG